MLVYCDSNVLIYLLDAVGPWNARAATRIASMQTAGDSVAFSDLTRWECRVKPLRLGATKTLADMDAFFGRPDVRFLPITRAVFDRATTIRATFNFKLGRFLALSRRRRGRLRSLSDERQSPFRLSGHCHRDTAAIVERLEFAISRLTKQIEDELDCERNGVNVT